MILKTRKRYIGLETTIWKACVITKREEMISLNGTWKNCTCWTQHCAASMIGKQLHWHLEAQPKPHDILCVQLFSSVIQASALWLSGSYDGNILTICWFSAIQAGALPTSVDLMTVTISWFVITKANPANTRVSENNQKDISKSHAAVTMVKPSKPQRGIHVKFNILCAPAVCQQALFKRYYLM